MNDLASHSNLGKFWRPKTSFNMVKFDEPDGNEVTVKSPHEGYRVSVTFQGYKSHPDYVRVRSTNWRCDGEPNAVYLRTDAEAFYRKLAAAVYSSTQTVRKGELQTPVELLRYSSYLLIGRYNATAIAISTTIIAL